MSSGPHTKDLVGGTLQVLGKTVIDRNANAMFNDVCMSGTIQVPDCMEIVSTIEDYDMVLLKRPTIVSEGFVGDYDPANWTIMENGGSVVMGNATVTMISANDDSGQNDTLACIEITPTVNTSFLFAWDWTTVDEDGPEYDPFGVKIGNEFIQLTDNSGLNSQSGSYAVCAPANKKFSFCFDQRATDSTLGPATVVISNFRVGNGKSKLVCTSRYNLLPA